MVVSNVEQESEEDGLSLSVTDLSQDKMVVANVEHGSEDDGLSLSVTDLSQDDDMCPTEGEQSGSDDADKRRLMKWQV